MVTFQSVMSLIHQIWSFVILIQILIPLTESEDPINRGSEIIGGKECDVMKYSFVVSVVGDYMCGGSMITLEWVLTAAHCLGDLSKTKIRSGFTAPAKYIQTRNAKKMIQHEQFDITRLKDDLRPELRYDIALILVDKPFKRTPYLSTAQLPSLGYSARCKEGKVLGIGAQQWPTEKKEGESFFKRKLMCVDLPIVNSTICSLTFRKAVKIDYSIICAMATDGKDSCSGDSGGPLLCEDKTLVGIVSAGKGCALDGHSATYTKVETFLSFINNTLTKYDARKSNANRTSVWKILLLTGVTWSSISRNIVINT